MVYLDSAATALPCEEALKEFVNIAQSCIGNSSSLHAVGFKAQRMLDTARHEIAQTIGAEDGEIYFTSGGTESSNIAILGAAAASRGGKIITTSLEHSAVYKTAQGSGLTHVEIGMADGKFDMQALENILTPDTVIVSIMLVNSETGLVLPVPEISKLVRKKAPRALIHCDAVQGYGKIPFTAAGLGVDMLSVSAHKIGAVKGIGFLYIKNGTRIVSPIYGGGHEKGIRSGTVNVAGACSLAKAAKIAFANIKENLQKTAQLRAYAKECLCNIAGVQFADLAGQKYSPYIISFSVEGMRGETLQHYLSDREIYVATASACSSHAKNDGRVLQAQGVSTERAGSTIRISFGYHNTKADIDALAAALETAILEISKGVK